MTVLVGLLGGVTKSWRFDRMSTVLKAETSDLTPMFAAFSKHHAVTVGQNKPEPFGGSNAEQQLHVRIGSV